MTTRDSDHTARSAGTERHLDRHGDGWRDERDGVEGERRWPLCLQRFAQIAGQLSASAATQVRSPKPRGA